MILRWLGSVALILTLTLGLGARAAEAPGRIVAVGDLHGDFAAWRAIAGAAGLLDAQGRWTGGRTTLVQVGDVVDRGPMSLAIVQDLMRLQREAARAGGRVIALVGNHEAMNMTGDLRYVSPADYAAYVTPGSARLRDEVFEANRESITAFYRRRDPAMTPEAIRAAWLAATPLGWVEHERAWSPNGRIGRWVVSNPAVVELDGTIFVHGGIGAAYARLPLDEINRRVSAALRGRETDMASIINDPAGPLWYRGYARNLAGAVAGPDEAEGRVPASAPAADAEAELDQTLAGYGARRMVIGHTPNLRGIAFLHQGQVVCIDTGISATYGGKLSYLVIEGGEASAHEVARPAGTN